MNAIFVCFGGLSNTGRLTGVAGLKAVEDVGIDDSNIFCLAALASKSQKVINKTKEAEKVIVVDGCQMECSKKIVEGVGLEIDHYINLVGDLEIKKSKPLDYDEKDVEKVKNKIIEKINE